VTGLKPTTASHDTRRTVPPPPAHGAAHPFAAIHDILDDLRAGRVIILVDDENRENEGDFICAAEKITPELINFMTRVGGGYLCVPLTGNDCARLHLHAQAGQNTSLRGTPLTVSVDGHPKHGIGTGISAFDRAKTILMLIDPATTPADFVRPGHINPLHARDGGVLARTGQTEGSVDLVRLAGLHPSAVLIEVVNPDGTMARLPDLQRLAAEHNLKICSVEQIIQYRLERETLVERIDPIEGFQLKTPHGPFTVYAYRSVIDPLPHLALTVGGIGRMDAATGVAVATTQPTLVRVHRRNLLGDIFDDLANPTGSQLRAAMKMIQEAGSGAIVYLRPEDAGDDVRARLQQVARPTTDADRDMNDPGLTRPDSIAGRTMPADQREIGIGSQILRDLGLSKLRVLTNHPRAYAGLHAFGLEVTEQVGIT